MMSVQLSSSQSLWFLVENPRQSMMALYKVSRSAPHAASTVWLSNRVDSRQFSRVSINDCLMSPVFSLLMLVLACHGGEQCDPKDGYLVTPAAAEVYCCSGQ